MIESLEPVAEMIVVLRDFYLIAVSMFTDPRQSGICVRLPTVESIHVVLRLADLAQVPDVVVKPVAVDMVNLHRWKPPVVPSPDNVVRVEIIFTAIDG